MLGDGNGIGMAVLRRRCALIELGQAFGIGSGGHPAIAQLQMRRHVQGVVSTRLVDARLPSGSTSNGMPVWLFWMAVRPRSAQSLTSQLMPGHQVRDWPASKASGRPSFRGRIERKTVQAIVFCAAPSRTLQVGDQHPGRTDITAAIGEPRKSAPAAAAISAIEIVEALRKIDIVSAVHREMRTSAKLAAKLSAGRPRAEASGCRKKSPAKMSLAAAKAPQAERRTGESARRRTRSGQAAGAGPPPGLRRKGRQGRRQPSAAFGQRFIFRSYPYCLRKYRGCVLDKKRQGFPDVFRPQRSITPFLAEVAPAT